MAEFEDADATAVVYAWLRDHPVVADEFGGPEHVTGVYEGPWPHLVVSPGNGGTDDDDMAWQSTQEVRLAVWDSYGNEVGRAGLLRLARLVRRLCAELPERDQPSGETVVCTVRSSGALLWSPASDGQGQAQVSLLVTVHPAP